MIKKFILSIFLFFFIISNLLSENCICYYFSYIPEDIQMFKDTCEYYNRVLYKVLGLSCETKPYRGNLYLPKDRKKAIVIVGHGNPLGLYLTYPDDVDESYTNARILSWKDLILNINSSIVIIDACYSGFAQDYLIYSSIDTLITSTYKENSWNVYDEENGYKIVSALAIALRCWFDDEYICPIRAPFFGNCPGLNINECQFQLIIDALTYGGLPDFYEWEMPSIGTCIWNNHPCSYYIK